MSKLSKTMINSWFCGSKRFLWDWVFLKTSLVICFQICFGMYARETRKKGLKTSLGDLVCFSPFSIVTVRTLEAILKSDRVGFPLIACFSPNQLSKR